MDWQFDSVKGHQILGDSMSTSDVLKAALEKKKQQTTSVSKSKSKGADKTAAGNQVTSNKPTKKSSGRGR